jgi:hypothetical protein
LGAQKQRHNRQGSDHTQQSPESPRDPPSKTARRHNDFEPHVIYLRSIDTPIRQPVFSHTQACEAANF